MLRPDLQSPASLSRTLKFGGLLLFCLLMAGCATSPPKNTDNICAIFEEKSGWYKDVSKASKKWGVPISVIMAFMHQESRFKATAKPPRKKILGFIPGFRPSDAYGYSQALKSTWAVYQRDSGSYGADRDDFGDAADFVGWYNHQSYKRSGIRKDDAYHLYLAYHEGHGGFNRRTFKNKHWLKKVAKKVSARSIKYNRQLQVCEASLQRTRWFFGLF